MSYNLDFYIKKFPNYNEEKVLEEFQKNLVKTNRDHKFFVNWKKVQQNAEKYKIELNLLNSLIGSNNLKDDFYELIKNYPEVLRVFPILIAIRDLNFPIIEDFS
ncbi:MAG TPA: restriction endonuclease, partial [archaeon]|nr:restriction endonuclease [archaeon]